MKINWKVRLRNPIFWLTAIPAFVSFVYTTLGLFGVVPPLSEDSAVKIGSATVSALAAVGVLVDPTTKGLCDSPDALCYKKPK